MTTIQVMLQSLFSRDGANINQIMDDLADKKLYPNKPNIHVRLNQYMCKGWIKMDTHIICKACSYSFSVYSLTDQGRMKLNNYREKKMSDPEEDIEQAGLGKIAARDNLEISREDSQDYWFNFGYRIEKDRQNADKSTCTN